MDTITQAALGACIAQAGFSHKLGRKALVVGVICGLLPDFDFLLSVGEDSFSYLETHRGWSHSLLVLPFVAFPIAWLAMKWGMRQRRATQPPEIPSHAKDYWVWYHLCFWALITHPLLDLFTSYGTQILAPVSNARFTLDSVAIVDLFYTVPLLLAIIAGLVRFDKLGNRQSWARGALVLSSLYLCLGLFNSWDSKQYATEQLREEAFQPVIVRTAPTMLNVVLWRIVAKDADGRYAVGFFSSIDRQPIQFEVYESEGGELVDKAIQSREGKILHWFSMDMLRAEVTQGEDGQPTVVLSDMRFGMVSKPVGSFFTGKFEFDQGENLDRVYTSREGREDFSPSYELESIWSMIWGED